MSVAFQTSRGFQQHIPAPSAEICYRSRLQLSQFAGREFDSYGLRRFVRGVFGWPSAFWLVFFHVVSVYRLVSFGNPHKIITGIPVKPLFGNLRNCIMSGSERNTNTRKRK